MQAIILAGGFGTRLREVVSDVPKPMANVGEMSFLEFLLRYLKGFGVEKVVLSVGYLQEKIIAHFGDEFLGIKIDYACEKQPLGTGGAIVNSLQKCDASKPVLVLNGDSFLQLNLADFLQFYEKSGADLVMALRKMDDGGRYGAVEIDDNGQIVDFKEKSQEVKKCLINAGIYLFKPELLQKMQISMKFSFESEFLMKFLSDFDFFGYVSDDYFIDIGIPSDYVRANDELPRILRFLESQNDEKYCNKALFLDRDGVINVDHGYVHKKENFDFINGIFDFCKKAQEKGYKVIIITNQAGIGRGYYSQNQFLELTKWVEGEFLKRGIEIVKTFYCPFHVDAKIEEFKGYSFDRKPNPGMILDAIEEFKIDAESSIMIGDKDSDMVAARRAGVGKCCLVDEFSLDFF